MQSVRQVPTNILLNRKVVDEDKNFTAHLTAYGAIPYTKNMGTCVVDSMLLYLKLRGAGAVRMRGKREMERRGDLEKNTKDHYHYWIENKGIVYDVSGGERVLVKKEDYYLHWKITDEEQAQYGMLFDSEFEGCGKSLKEYVRTANNAQLYNIIDTMNKKMGFGNLDLKKV